MRSGQRPFAYLLFGFPEDLTSSSPFYLCTLKQLTILRQLRHVAVIDEGRPVQQDVRLRASQKFQDAVLELADDAFSVPSKQFHRSVQRLSIERFIAVVIPNLLSIKLFTRLQDAEVIAQLVNEHPTDKGIERDALGLVPSDDVVQTQSLIPIIYHQRRADGKRSIVIRRKLRRPQLGSFLHERNLMLRTPFNFYPFRWTLSRPALKTSGSPCESATSSIKFR